MLYPEIFLKKAKEDPNFEGCIQAAIDYRDRHKHIKEILFARNAFRDIIFNVIDRPRAEMDRDESLQDYIANLFALATWKYSKGVYRIDPDIYEHLFNSDISHNIPSNVLLRLPEYCLYFDLKGYDIPIENNLLIDRLKQGLQGFFAFLQYRNTTDEYWLCFAFAMEGYRLLEISVPLNDKPIIENLKIMYEGEIANGTYTKARGKEPSFEDILGGYSQIKQIAQGVLPFINMVLYVCQEKPEINLDRKPGVSPCRVEFKKTKKGLKLFEPPNVKVWKVGSKTGEQLRKSRTIAVETPRGAVSPYVRKAHWHGYWKGPKKGLRTFIYHWLPPLYCAGDNIEKDT